MRQSTAPQHAKCFIHQASIVCIQRSDQLKSHMHAKLRTLAKMEYLPSFQGAGSFHSITSVCQPFRILSNADERNRLIRDFRDFKSDLKRF